MATPYVTGLAALLWSYAPSLSRDQVKETIQNTADDLGTPGWDQYFGWGRINAWKALSSVSLQTAPDQVTLLMDDQTGPVEGQIQLTTPTSNVITWTSGISPTVSWLSASMPASGTISAASSPIQVTVVATDSALTYDTYTTTLLITGTTASSVVIGPHATQVRLIYVSQLHRYYFPIMFKH